jgi:hypothetical protein
MSNPPTFLRLWPDNPTALDLLGFEDIAAPVLEAIARERLDPVAVGVFGDWGSGKTTVLEIINEQLKTQPDTLVAYTRPWEYDPTLDARATLITEVLEVVRVKAEADKGFWTKSKDKFEKLAERIKWSKAIALASKSAVTFTLPSPDKVVEIFGEAGKVADPTLQGFRKEFSELMGEFTGIKRVVVLVDDLDRCLPPTVVMTLEAIKLFLSVKKMAFVIATDEALVKAAITKHFDPSQQGARMAADYLEKIIQIPLTVPALGRGDTEAYLAMMLLDQHFDNAEEPLKVIAAHCAERRRRGEPEVLKNLPESAVPPAGQEDLALAGELAPVLFEKLDGNPRRLKRFLNAFWVRSDIASRRGAALSPRPLARLMVLERIEPDAFAQLFEWSKAGTLTENLRKLDDGETLADAHSAFAWWGKMAPKLADENLGPYLRLAAALRRQSGPRSDLRADLAELLDRLAYGSAPDKTEGREKLRGLPEGDRRVMAREIVDQIRTDPSTQDSLGEPLTELVDDEALVSEIADGLKRLDASRVEAALIISLAGGQSVPDPIRSVIRTWDETGRLNPIAANAANDALNPGTA